MSPMFVEVAINLPQVRGTFDYHLPPTLRNQVAHGHLVTVPFGKRRVQGIVINTPDKPAVPETRPVESLVDPHPVVTLDQIALARWLKEQTLTPFIDCLTLMLPPGLSQQADSVYSLVDEASHEATPAQKALIKLLERRGPLRTRQITRALPRQRWRKAAESLIRHGVLKRTSVLNPPQVRARQVRTARLAVPPERALDDPRLLGKTGGNAAKRREAAIEILKGEREPLEVSWLYAESGVTWADLRYLEKQGLIAFGEAEIWRDPLASTDFVASEAPRLTEDQEPVWTEIRKALQKPVKRSAPLFLLHGVTGSGKTEIYLRAVAEALQSGRSAIVLVPEISLTPQTVRRFLARFPGQIGLSHSQLSDGERYDTWRRSRAGDLQVVVGARSALFTPLPEIGLIILDESHDDSYKQHGRDPRYHAREAALAYSEILNAVCILGSATPDVTTTFRAEKGELQLLSLPKRIMGHRQRLSSQATRLGVKSRYTEAGGDAHFMDLPPVKIVDMRQELRAGNRSLFSRALQKAMGEILEAHEQAILFLNRRGTSTYVFCRDCGWVIRCPRCESPLTYHSTHERLMCHHCGYTRQSPKECPECASQRIKHFGAGTQRIQAELERIFPGVRSLRWDWDTTRTKGAHAAILSTFSAHQADVLIGTQMIAKGLDLPLVTLVGVMSADTGIHLPDFRAAERTFQVLTQVAGRAGRSLLGGKVFFQSYQPDHYAIQAAAAHDYRVFYEEELRHRKDLGFPPYRRLVRLLIRHHAEKSARSEAERMANVLRANPAFQDAKADFIGPVPCFHRRIRGYFRWQIVLRAAEPLHLIPDELHEGWTVDVDPTSLL
jgi:primosomal protein N' (replication factor Y)